MSPKKAEPKAPERVTIYHPTLPTEVEVLLSQVEEWTEQGWRKTKPSN